MQEAEGFTFSGFVIVQDEGSVYTDENVIRSLEFVAIELVGLIDILIGEVV